MARVLARKERTHTLTIQMPTVFWKELEDFYKERKSYNNYAEMTRHLLRAGLDTLKVDDNGGNK